MKEAVEARYADAMERACRRALEYRQRSEALPPRPSATLTELRAAFDVGLPDTGRDPVWIIDTLADAAEPGLVGITSPHFFGWVMGASHPVGVAAEFLTAAYGQNAAIFQCSPAAAVAEEVASGWLLDLLDLPSESAMGFTTGATMASFICLAAARRAVLQRAGWDLDELGLIGAPQVHVFVSDQAHATIHSGLRHLGFGERQKVVIHTDSQCRMLAGDLAKKLPQYKGPKIIISQAGHINSGGFDDFAAIADLAREQNAWHHVDGAFGLWARAVPSLAHHCAGVSTADSWAVDGHKWLQVPYDSGFAIVKNAAAMTHAMDISASYITPDPEDGRNPTHFGPELSRRARGFAVWATLQALGRKGVEEMVTRHTRCAQHLASIVAREPGIRVLNDVVVNQVALAFGSADEPLPTRNAYARAVIDEVRRENTSFVGGAEWKGEYILRASVISRGTGLRDMDQLAESITRAWSLVRSGPGSAAI